MRSPELRALGLAAVVALTACTSTPTSQSASGAAEHRLGLGKPVTEAQLAAWDIDIRTPDGAGLPPGSGSIAKGKAVYESQCLACHGAEAKGGSMFGTMVGGIGSFTTNTRVLTPGSMYPYAGVLFDYVRRAMPLTAPQSLSNDDVYAVTAFILSQAQIVPADATLNKETLPNIVMPNRNGFRDAGR